MLKEIVKQLMTPSFDTTCYTNGIKKRVELML